jgi:hypothetical protein
VSQCDGACAGPEIREFAAPLAFERAAPEPPRSDPSERLAAVRAGPRWLLAHYSFDPVDALTRPRRARQESLRVGKGMARFG